MSARLADVIDVLDAAYPPRLAQDWDSVGLVCGDPDETVDSVTIAVDATAAVVAEVPDRGLLLAHHPLLLRGVDTVAASTAKGALLHQMIRTGRALFTAHTNADAASPGVSDALAEALGLEVDEVLAPLPAGPDLDKWVVYVPAENADAVREAIFAAGARSHRRLLALQLERGGHRPVPAARRRVAGDRQRGHRRAGARGTGRGHRPGSPARPRARRDAGRAPLRGARIRHLRAGAGAGECGAGPCRLIADAGAVVGLRVSGVRCAARHLVGGARRG